METLTSTDARRYCHLLTYVFDREHFFEQPFTYTEFLIHLRGDYDLYINSLDLTPKELPNGFYYECKGFNPATN